MLHPRFGIANKLFGVDIVQDDDAAESPVLALSGSSVQIAWKCKLPRALMPDALAGFPQGWHPDVMFFKVKDADTGDHIADCLSSTSASPVSDSQCNQPLDHAEDRRYSSIRWHWTGYPLSPFLFMLVMTCGCRYLR